MRVELNHEKLTKLIRHAINWVGPVNYNSAHIAATKIMEELESGTVEEETDKT